MPLQIKAKEKATQKVKSVGVGKTGEGGRRRGMRRKGRGTQKRRSGLSTLLSKWNFYFSNSITKS
jgi:hypothetical protein